MNNYPPNCFKLSWTKGLHFTNLQNPKNFLSVNPEVNWGMPVFMSGITCCLESFVCRIYHFGKYACSLVVVNFWSSVNMILYTGQVSSDLSWADWKTLFMWKILLTKIICHLYLIVLLVVVLSMRFVISFYLSVLCSKFMSL